MQHLPVVEIIVILSLAASLPTLATAMWHGWKFEQHKAEHKPEPAAEDDASCS